MGISVTYFGSIDELTKHVDTEFKSSMELYSSYAKKIESARGSGRPDSSSKSSTSVTSRSARQQEIAGFSVLSDPSPDYEISILDDALKSVQEKIDALKRIKQGLLPKLGPSGRVTVISEDGIPIAFINYSK
jgi:hypothetical protein